MSRARVDTTAVNISRICLFFDESVSREEAEFSLGSDIDLRSIPGEDLPGSSILSSSSPLPGGFPGRFFAIFCAPGKRCLLYNTIVGVFKNEVIAINCQETTGPAACICFIYIIETAC